MEVLILARDAVSGGAELGVATHVAVAVRIPQPVAHHQIHHLRIAHALPPSRLWQRVRHVGHGLETTSHDDVGDAELDLLCTQDDRLHAGRADLRARRRKGARARGEEGAGMRSRGVRK